MSKDQNVCVCVFDLFTIPTFLLWGQLSLSVRFVRLPFLSIVFSAAAAVFVVVFFRRSLYVIVALLFTAVCLFSDTSCLSRTHAIKIFKTQCGEFGEQVFVFDCHAPKFPSLHQSAAHRSNHLIWRL